MNDLKRIQKEITDRRMDRQNQTRRNPAKQNTVRREGYSLLNRPSEWTVKNIDEVAAVVREKLWAEGASAFWNVYREPFSDVPCNEVLRSIKKRIENKMPLYGNGWARQGTVWQQSSGTV